MSRTLKVELEIVVDDLPADQRREAAELGDCKVSDLPRVKDLDAHEVAELLEGVGDGDDEIFGGSGIFAKFSSVQIKKAEWA